MKFFLVFLAGGIVLSGCGRALLSTRAELEEIRNRMDENGLENTQLYKEVGDLIGTIDSGTRRLSASKKEYIIKRAHDIDIELNQYLIKDTSGCKDQNLSPEEKCRRFFVNVNTALLRAKDANELAGLEWKMKHVLKTYNALNREERFNLSHELLAYHTRAYIASATLNVAPIGKVPNAFTLVRHLSSRRAALRKRMKEPDQGAEIPHVIRSVDHMIDQHFPAFKRIISASLSTRHSPAITDILKQIAEDLGNANYKADILKIINDTRPQKTDS